MDEYIRTLPIFIMLDIFDTIIRINRKSSVTVQLVAAANLPATFSGLRRRTLAGQRSKQHDHKII